MSKNIFFRDGKWAGRLPAPSVPPAEKAVFFALEPLVGYFTGEQLEKIEARLWQVWREAKEAEHDQSSNANPD